MGNPCKRRQNYDVTRVWKKWKYAVSLVNTFTATADIEPGKLVGNSAGLAIERLRVRIPGSSCRGIFFSRVNFVYWLLFGVRSTSVLPQWHVEDPGHSAKSAGGRLNLDKHTLLAQRSRSGADYGAAQAYCGSVSGNELARNSSGYTQPQSAQFSEPVWIDPCLKSGISVRELIST